MYDLRNMLLEHRRLLGTHVQLADHRICELLGASGYDFLWIDTEHTSTDYQVLEAHLISARAGGLPAVVRVPWNDHVLVKRVLDMGPDGIVFPMINSAAEARRAIASCIYPPEGTRSYGPVRAMRYGTESLTDLLKDPYGGPVRLLQVESASAVGQLADIAAVPGVDGFILGPMASFFISLIVSFIEMITVSTTGPYGFLMNVISTCAFAIPAAVVYRKRHTHNGAVLGLAIGTVVMVICMVIWNYIVTPFYMGVPREQVAAMLVPVFLPFNLVKGGIMGGLTLLIYAPIVSALRKAKLVEPSQSGGKKKFNAGYTLFALMVLVTFVLLFLVIAGVL